MRLVWSENSKADVLGIYHYIASQDTSAAQRLMESIAATARRLSTFPELGRASDRVDIRLLQVPRTPYLLPYRVIDGDIEILAVFDQRRARPPEWT